MSHFGSRQDLVNDHRKGSDPLILHLVHYDLFEHLLRQVVHYRKRNSRKKGNYNYKSKFQLYKKFQVPRFGYKPLNILFHRLHTKKHFYQTLQTLSGVSNHHLYLRL